MVGETLGSLLFIPVDDREVEFLPTEKYARMCHRKATHTVGYAATGRIK